LSTTFHPQTDGKSEQVNQVIEQYLHICGNFQQDNWVSLLPIIEFAYNAQPHHSTHKSPFKVWYGFQPTFKPPLQLQTRLQSVDECIQYLEQICKEVTAALIIAAKEMRSRGPKELSYTFHKDNLVLLEATNLQTTHPKAKLTPQRYGPFKVIWASPTNCKLQLPETMRVHPVFYNSLLKPYHKTQAHGPNFEWPPPEIVGGEEGHYKIDKVLVACPTRNCKSTQYFVYWKGYTDANNSWIPARELTHAKELVTEFHACQRPKEGICIQALQAQGDPKEGILLQAVLMPPNPSYKPVTSRTHDHGNLSHDPTCDYGNPSHNLTHDSSSNLSATMTSHDLLAWDSGKIWPCDPGKITYDQTCFGCISSPLINMWKIVGTINKMCPLNNQQRCDMTWSTDLAYWGKTPIKTYDVICSYCILTAQSPITCNSTYPKLCTDHPVFVYRTYKFRWTVLRLFSCQLPILEPHKAPSSSSAVYHVLPLLAFCLFLLNISLLLLWISHLQLRTIIKSHYP